MAACIRNGAADAPQSQQVRDGIKVDKLLERLERHALGEDDMSATELRAAEILLKKSLPDLQTLAPGARDEEAGMIATVIFKGLND